MSTEMSSTGHSAGEQNIHPAPDEKFPSVLEHGTQLQNEVHQAELLAPTRARNMNKATWICVLLSLLSSIFLFALDNTVVADVQPRIIHTLGEIEKLPWVSVSYALGAIAVNLFVYVSEKHGLLQHL